jgi:hypothetical protein
MAFEIKSRLWKFLLVVFGLIFFSVAIYLKYTTQISEYLEPEILATHYNGAHFVGSQTCIECHKEIYETHLATAHFNTSATAAIDHIKGNFAEGHNKLNLSGVSIKMSHEDNQFYQLSEPYFGETGTKKDKIDIVVGSGVKGQSHLGWENNRLYQLQASYYEPTRSWINSPNFPDVPFKRSVDDSCLKCHVTFAKKADVFAEDPIYDRTQIMLGIDCERCHGPLEQHVRFHRNNPAEMAAKFVDSYQLYTRQQRLDACAVCHSGLQAQQIKGNPFSFLAGDTLAFYTKNYMRRNSNANLDVHGNQVGLLMESECFKNTEKMDCLTCHDPHKNQRGDTVDFNLKCISCHTMASINSSSTAGGHEVGQDCISCHMPLLPSKVMTLQLGPGMEEVPVYIRTHLIGNYDN